MAWRSESIVNQRMAFVTRAMDANVVFTELCREFGVSTKTGYKWLARFREGGWPALADRSRRPHSHANTLSEDVVCDLVRVKRDHPSWGPRKVRELYRREFHQAPSESSVKRVLERAGMVQRRRRRSQSHGQPLQRREPAKKPNHIWTVDFKGHWLIPGQGRCEPLTIRDEYSRYVICLQAMRGTAAGPVREQFERAFATYGLPQIIRSDNGSPFACSRAPFGLSRLAAWWLALGIDLDRIDPGCPQQNGGHERLHLDIRRELQGLVSGDPQAQQEAFDLWRHAFNWQRPHDALKMKTPSEVYEHSPRRYQEQGTVIDYPFGYLPRQVSQNGKICIDKRRLFLTETLAGWTVGLEPLAHRHYALWFDHLRLGEIDLSTHSVTWADTPTTTSSKP